jgi:pimeloyl-ACP methyl ester carboxylesterase
VADVAGGEVLAGVLVQGFVELADQIFYAIGSESGPVFETARQHFQSMIPSTEAVVLPGVNHLMQMRDPKLVAAAIADFLSRQRS